MFSMPTTYPEPKGLSVIEAMANAIPWCCHAGGFPALIEKTGGGVLFEPNDVDSLAQSILAVEESEMARDLGKRGAQSVRNRTARRKWRATLLMSTVRSSLNSNTDNPRGWRFV
jgi:glycosyltransferase involved in cell wall biosynthesis